MRASTRRRHKERQRRQRTDYVKKLMAQRKGELTARLREPYAERWSVPTHIWRATQRVAKLSLKEVENFPYEAHDEELVGLLAMKLRDWEQYRDGVPVEWLLNFHGIDPEAESDRFTTAQPVVFPAPSPQPRYSVNGASIHQSWHTVGSTTKRMSMPS